MTSAIAFPAVVIGLMSGTSADGVDAAILTTDGHDMVEPGESLFMPYDDQLRDDILALTRGQGDEAEVARRLTDVHILAVQELVKKAKIKAHLVGFHGQTIRHAPAEGITVQIGDAQRMANELRIPVVADFRSADVKAGGQGAPLVPLYHAALAHGLKKPVMVVNIGGVSNATWIGPNGEIVAFDCGPGNALLDDWVHKHTGKRYDANGELAAQGMSDGEIVRTMLKHPFFLADAPKSLDRNQFDNWQTHPLSLEDGAATLTTITAASIALSCAAVPQLPAQMLITGGGRHNATLMHLIMQSVSMPVLPVETAGWNGDMLEAQAFAYLAARSVQGLPLSLPTTTGVKEPMMGGVLFTGEA